MSATSWLNTLLVIIGISAVLTYEWIHENLHRIHYFLAAGVTYAAGFTAAQQKYDHEIQLYSAYVKCQNLVSAGLQASCHKRNLPTLVYYPQQPSFGDIILESLRSLPFVALGVAIAVAIMLAWNRLNPKHQLEDHFMD